MKSFITGLLLLHFFLLVGYQNIFSQSSNDLDPRWSRVVIDMTTMSSSDPNFKWDEPPQVTRQYFFGDGSVIVNPNFRPHPTTNSTQSETSVDMHPSEVNIILGSANTTPWPVTTIWGTGTYWSLDGAQTWAGGDIPPFGQNGGFPVSVIGANGYFYQAYLTSSYNAIGVAVSTDFGFNWTTHIAYSPTSADKEHFMVDKFSSSPFYNRLYYPWSDFNAVDGEVALVYSTDFAETWSSYINLSGTITPLGNAFAQGPNVQTAANGDVYVCYAIYDANSYDGEDAIGFSKSTDGGVTWSTIRVYDQVNFGIRGTLASKSGIRVNSFPSMAVDNSGGANDGNIYITWTQRGGHPPAGSDPDIAMIMSDDGGATWTAPVRVNDDPLSNGKDQYFSWACVDQSNGRLSIIFYDSRDVPNNQAEVFVAYSYSGGSTFNNVKVSDHVFNPVPIPGLAGGYQGDHISIASLNDIAYGYWMDNSTGIYQGWMVKLEFSAPCPVELPTNPNPVSGATNVPISLGQISWTNGAGANTNDLYFGSDPGNLPLVQSGTLASSWNIPNGTLDYLTTYYWKVIEIGDTCNQSGPLWSFTTENDPNLWNIFCDDFESGSGDWTITNDGGTCVWETRALNSRPYTMPQSASGNGFTADVDLCGLGTTLLSTATITQTLNLSNSYYTLIEFDNDFRILQSTDEAHVEVSTDGGSTWIGIWDKIGVDVRSTHESIYATILDGQSNCKVRLRSVQPGWDWWWAVDNFCIYNGCLSCDPPARPTNLTAEATNFEQVTLNWEDNSWNEYSFLIERKDGDSLSANPFSQIGSTSTNTTSFIDSTVTDSSVYTYRVRAHNQYGNSAYSNLAQVLAWINITGVTNETPIEFSLSQNFPNPFNPSTVISYWLPVIGFVTLKVYDLLGREITTLVKEEKPAGEYEVVFDGTALPSGIYFYQLKAGEYSETKKMILLN